jgi:hypothetical protein
MLIMSTPNDVLTQKKFQAKKNRPKAVVAGGASRPI